MKKPLTKCNMSPNKNVISFNFRSFMNHRVLPGLKTLFVIGQISNLVQSSLLIVFFIFLHFLIWIFLFFGFQILTGIFYFFFITFPVFLIKFATTFDFAPILIYYEIFNNYLNSIDKEILNYWEQSEKTILNLIDSTIFDMLEHGLCIFGPLFASICSGFLSRFLNKEYVLKLTFFFFSISLLCAVDLLFFYLADSEDSPIYYFICTGLFYEFGIFDFIFVSEQHTATMFSWFDSGAFVTFYLLFDNLSIIMTFIVLTVSILVHLYSIDYMENDPHFFRFFSYLSAFTFFMLLMVTASNFIQLFFGWEGIGVLSMLLINFWYTRVQANKAALKAVLVNRIGDIFLLFCMCFSFYFFKTLNFEVLLLLLYEQRDNMLFFFSTLELFTANIDILRFFGILILLASLVKSAQVGFYIWLPDAMEGPTPVSALLHAATMVTAGVFLLLRFSFIFDQLGDLLYILSWCSMFTSLFAGLIALYQYDIKKIIAYSTCSQLALMFAAISSSKYALSFFHLFTHAWFKALLFLTAGVIIHALGGEQDLRRMGGLLNISPLAAFCMFIGTLSILGVPLLSGFYSKETILFSMLGRTPFMETDSFILFYFFLFTSILTILYSFRLFLLIFYGLPNGRKYDYFNLYAMKNFTIIVLSILVVFSVFSGYLFNELFIGYGNQLLEIERRYPLDNEILPQFLPGHLKRFLFILCLVLFFFCFNAFTFFYKNTLRAYRNTLMLLLCLLKTLFEHLFDYLKFLFKKVRTRSFWFDVVIGDFSILHMPEYADENKEQPVIFDKKFDWSPFSEILFIKIIKHLFDYLKFLLKKVRTRSFWFDVVIGDFSILHMPEYADENKEQPVIFDKKFDWSPFSEILFIKIIKHLFDYFFGCFIFLLKKVRTRSFWFDVVIGDFSILHMPEYADENKEQPVIFDKKFDWSLFVEFKGMLVNPIIIYTRYNAFLLNNLFNKVLYSLIEGGQYVFSENLEFVFFNFSHFYTKFLVLLAGIRIRVINRFSFSIYFSIVQTLLLFLILIFIFGENTYIEILNLTQENFFYDQKK